MTVHSTASYIAITFALYLGGCDSRARGTDDAPPVASNSDVIPSSTGEAPPPSEGVDTPIAKIEPLDLGNGISFPEGESVSAFTADNQDYECIDWQSKKICENTSPDPSDCPAETLCASVSYIFVNDRMVGFQASYKEINQWDDLRQRTFKLSPADYVIVPSIKNSQVRAWRWTSEQGYLTFVHHSGLDLNGAPIRTPFSISFGPDAFAPSVTGRTVQTASPSDVLG